jgi:regulator of replication initiation timing
MKDAKISLLLSILLLLLLASIALLYTWGYYKFYSKKPGEKTSTQMVSNNSLKTGTEYRDSLQKMYAATLSDINTNSDSSSKYTGSPLPGTDLQPGEINKLKEEIAYILKNHPLKADLDIARQKILELQNKLTELHNKNVHIEDENKRLNGKLAQLVDEDKGVAKDIKNGNVENKSDTKNTSSPSVFTVSELHFSAVKKDAAEQETGKAEQTEKLVGSFTVKNNFPQINTAEIVVVVLQPDGQVMQGSTWESGTFDTPEGRKIYSSKLRFEYNSGEAKRLLFSLNSDKYEKGEYALQVYYNSKIVGKAFKTLF